MYNVYNAEHLFRLALLYRKKGLNICHICEKLRNFDHGFKKKIGPDAQVLLMFMLEHTFVYIKNIPLYKDECSMGPKKFQS